MRKLTALVAGMTLAMTALPAAAGVVITQKQHVTSGTNSRDSEQTISVQGNKQKMVTEKHTIITDLDVGKMYVLDPNAKTYFEIEFPPKGQMATMMAASTNAAMNFKKAGTTRDIAGYKCTDYDGGGHMMAGDYTVKECFSTNGARRRGVCGVRETTWRTSSRAQAHYGQWRDSRRSAARAGLDDEDGEGEHPGDGAGAGGQDQRDDGEAPTGHDQHSGREDRNEETGGRRFRGAVGFHQERPAGTGRNDDEAGRNEDGAWCGRTGSRRVASSALI